MLGRMREFVGRLRVVRSPDYKPVLRQYWEMLWLFFRQHLSPTEYYIYEVGRKNVSSKRLREYLITAWAVREMRPRLNSRLWEPVLRNKILFNQHMARHGLPVAAFYGLFHSQYGYDHNGTSLRDEIDLARLLQSLEGKNIIVKPLDGLKGSGITKYVVERGGFLRNPAGDIYSTQEMIEYMLRWDRGLLMENCLFNHPEIDKYNPSSLNTCRVVTFVNKRGESRVLFATARFGRQGQVTDNWSAGGVAVGVDLETGFMGRGLLLPQFGGWLETHPDSNQPFAGAELPYWREVLELVQKAALVLPWCHAIGWDVAVTPEGPVLVEGNGQWNPSLGQAFTGGLLTPQFRKELVELGLRFPA